jgi:hypothetical protein
LIIRKGEFYVKNRGVVVPKFSEFRPENGGVDLNLPMK